MRMREADVAFVSLGCRFHLAEASAMSFELDQIHLVYLLVVVSRPGFMVEGFYLLFFSGASYRQNVNRRLKLLRNEPNRENILVQLRKERGLTGAGNYRLGIEAINRLVLQSGLTFGIVKLLLFIAAGGVASFGARAFCTRKYLLKSLLIALFCGDGAALSGAALPARAPAEGIWRAISRCA